MFSTHANPTTTAMRRSDVIGPSSHLADRAAAGKL